MNRSTHAAYAKGGFGTELPLGKRPAILVVDLINGFTDPRCAVGSDLTPQVEATKALIESARPHGVPVIFTTIGYQPDLQDGGLWPLKAPGLAELQLGSREVEVDARLRVEPGDPIVTKKGASAFFGTNLMALLAVRGVDTVILCGATTSGCIRATAVDLMQHGYRALVPRDCVGDRAEEPHEANLFDINAKYGNVVSLAEAQDYLSGLPTLMDLVTSQRS